MVDIQTVSIAIASSGVFLAAIYYILQLRHQVKVKQIDLVMRLYSTYGNEEYSKAVIRYLATEYRDYNDFVEKYGPINPEEPTQVAFRMIPMFYEGVGLLLYRKLVHPDLVYDLFNVRMFWEKYKPYAEAIRKQFDEPRIYCWFEYLYNEMKKREQAGVKNG
jgi:hypothetical protein